MNVNLFEKANKIIRECDTAYFGVLDENGFPDVSTVSIVKPENIFEARFTTNKDSNKVKRLLRNNKASLCIHTGSANITLVGTAEILTDQETKSLYWLDWFIDHYPGGATDPDYVVIRFKSQRVSLWLGGEGAEFAIDELLTTQSRCGLLCSWCAFKVSHGCQGCVALEGKPFWGECPVAKCCQDRGYAHCGQCGDIPCDILKEFSCGEGEHFDRPVGARIAVCKAWAAAGQWSRSMKG